MLKFPCLVLDHDDTVVQTLKTLSYPFWCLELEQFRPGRTMSLSEYVLECYRWGFADMCREIFHFTDEELQQEHSQWNTYIHQNIPSPFPGIDRIIRRQKEEGGMLFVVSHSNSDTISRDYNAHFGIQPDGIYGWERPKHERKPNPFPLMDIMARFELEPSQLLMIDDLKPGYDMALSCDVDFAAVGWASDIEPIERFMRLNCRLYFKEVCEFSAFLR